MVDDDLADLTKAPAHKERDDGIRVLNVICARIVDAYEGDSEGARDALLQLLAVPIADLVDIEKRLATKRMSAHQIAGRITLEFVRRLDAWAKTEARLFGPSGSGGR
jgi:hypothetical protein